MASLEAIKNNPASVYKHPHDIIDDKTLSRAEKIDVLRRWAYDEREKSVAEEENMIVENNQNTHGNILDEILKTLIELGVDKDQNSPPPTKQG
jgi:hypothetical protein